jgi:predicted nuclease of predicted toxin-antitoxin system
VLIDECAPAELKTFLSQHGLDCVTVAEAGWSGKTNGELLALAGQQFDALATIDANLTYQQNVSGLHIAIVVIRARTNRMVDLRPHFPACLETLRSIKAGTIVEVGP